MQDQLQRAMNIARNTGDRLIIFDTAKTNEAYVIMSLDDYEKNLANANRGGGVSGLTEDELLDRINCDIATWKSEKEEKKNKEKKLSNFRKNYGRLVNNDFPGDEYDDFFEDFEEDDCFEEYEDEEAFGPEPEKGQFSPPTENFDFEDEPDDRGCNKNRNAWNIPSERKKAAEEIIEEDRQYLEEI